MRVLMLGWEFPPHISGGLGVACEGLTRGLAHHGVDVTFVVPRTFGDEDVEHIELIGLSGQAPQRAATGDAVERTSRTTAPTPAGAAPADAEADAAESEPGAPVDAPEFVTVALDSPLQPYMVEAEYEAALREATGSGASSRSPTTPAAGTPDVARSPTAWDEVVEQIVSAPAGAPQPTTFGGGYGAGLFDEVWRYAGAVAEVARHTSFDLVHAHDWMTWPAGIAAARVAGVPFVAHVHASEWDRSGENPNPRVRDLEAFGLARADRVVAVSHFTAGVLKQRYGVDPEAIRVVHNAVVHRADSDGPGAKVIEEPIVLFLGRVTFQKGPDYFLEAAKRVLAIRPEVKFVVSGSGDMLPHMIEHAAEIGIARNVHFTGFLRGKDVERMYGQADLYVMPSVSEPFGISPLEAMELDVPVIVSRQSGVSEVLQHALKVDFWDIDDLADKILAVLERPALGAELRSQGREEVRRMHWEASGAHLKGVYEEILS